MGDTLDAAGVIRSGASDVASVAAQADQLDINKIKRIDELKSIVDSGGQLSTEDENWLKAQTQGSGGGGGDETQQKVDETENKIKAIDAVVAKLQAGETLTEDEKKLIESEGADKPFADKS